MQKVTLMIDLKRLLLLKKLKILFCGHILLAILKLQKLFERLAKELQKINQTEFKVEKSIKKKKDKLYVKWKGYNNSIKSLIDKKSN